MLDITQIDADRILGRIFGPRLRVDPLDELRAHTLETLLALRRTHAGLRMPRSMDGYRHDAGLMLDLHFEQDEQVDAWAAVIGLGEACDKPTGDGQAWREADRFAREGETVWLRWRSVRILCYPHHRREVQS